MPHYNKYRVRKGRFGKAILQQWFCYPSSIPSHLAGDCEWVDVSYKNAPQLLIENKPGE